MKRIAILYYSDSRPGIPPLALTKARGPVEAQPASLGLALGGPPEGSTGTYRIQDVLGAGTGRCEIAGYEYLSRTTTARSSLDTAGCAVLPVVGNDSTFTFSADEPSTPPRRPANRSTCSRGPTRSSSVHIDRECLRSKLAAYARSRRARFSARGSHPEAAAIKLNPASVAADFHLPLEGHDWIDDKVISQDPDSVQFALVYRPCIDRANYDPTIDRPLARVCWTSTCGRGSGTRRPRTAQVLDDFR